MASLELIVFVFELVEIDEFSLDEEVREDACFFMMSFRICFIDSWLLDLKLSMSKSLIAYLSTKSTADSIAASVLVVADEESVKSDLIDLTFGLDESDMSSVRLALLSKDLDEDEAGMDPVLFIRASHRCMSFFLMSSSLAFRYSMVLSLNRMKPFWGELWWLLLMVDASK